MMTLQSTAGLTLRFFFVRSGVPAPERSCCGGVGAPERGSGYLPEAPVVQGKRDVRLPTLRNDHHERERFTVPFFFVRLSVCVSD